MEFTIDEVIEELKIDKDWDLADPLRENLLKDFAWTLFGL